MNPTFRILTFGALLTLCLAPACSDNEPEAIPLQLERSSNTLRFSWEGDNIHYLEVTQCNSEPSADACSCSGAVVWKLGPNETEKFRDVALEAPFISSPLEYGVRPASDRRGYASRALESGKLYVVQARRAGPCDNTSDQGCQKTIARGCQRFDW
jgi:hypothetical protein